MSARHGIAALLAGWLSVGIATASPQAEIDVAKAAMMSDPLKALAHAEAAEDRSDGDHAATTTALWLQGEALTRYGRPADALVRLSEAEALSCPATTKLCGDVALAEARAHLVLQRQIDALEAFQRAHGILMAVGDERGQAMSLMGIARLHREARRYDRALDYFEQAERTYSDDVVSVVLTNNRASVLRELERHDEARVALLANLERLATTGDTYARTNTYLQLADTALDVGDTQAAERHLAEARASGAETPNKSWQSFARLVDARLAVARDDAAAAEAAFDALFTDYDIADPSNAHRVGHEAAAAFYAARGEMGLAYRHRTAFAEIESRVNSAAAANSFNLLNAEFEAANRELEIERLKAARLEAEIAVARQQARTRAMVTGAFALACAGVLATLLWHLRSAWAASRVLEATNAELEEANAVKTRFLANTSHEIRTPLNAVLGMTEAILSDTDEALAPLHRERLTTIQRSGTLLLGVVSDILDVSKMEAGRMEAREAPTDLAVLCESLAAMHRPNAEAKGLALRLDVDPGLPAFVTDERLVAQALGNLIGNAVKFTEEGEVRVGLSEAEDGFAISVRDTGIGIAADKLGAVFEPFAQAEDGATRRHGGTGLGLAIVEHIAEVLGGEVTAESALGEGTTFTLRVRADRAETPEPAPTPLPAPAHAPDLSALRVLLAEDNPVNVAVVRALIGRQVGCVDVVETGTDAVERVRMQPYDVILMDNQMPGMSGAQATTIIRRMPAYAQTPIIGVTGDVAPDVRAGLIESGMDSIVAKPITQEALLGAMATALSVGATVPAAALTA